MRSLTIELEAPGHILALKHISLIGKPYIRIGAGTAKRTQAVLLNRKQADILMRFLSTAIAEDNGEELSR